MAQISIASASLPPLGIGNLTVAAGSAGAMAQHQTYNIGLRGLIGNEVSPWSTEAGYVKKYEVVEASEDVLALSCAWHRMRKIHSDGGQHPGINTLLQRELFSQLTAEDRAKAEEVRDYYSKKIMLWKLKGKQLSRFREDMNLFIHDRSNKISEQLLPLVYRLPEFYEYDVEFEDMVRTVSKEFPTAKRSDTFIPKLTSLKKFNIGKTHTKKTEYWMADQHNNVHLITVQMNNPLKHLWDTLFDSGQTLSIKGTGNPKRRDDLQYREFTKWELA